MTGRGAQMSIVSTTESRSDPRTVYMPPPPDGMAHRSLSSPDWKWVVVIEMDGRSWLPCRLVPMDGSSPGKTVGPTPAQCTDAAWSPDGQWMYFTAYTSDGVHTWRQRFADGTPEQVTFGVATEEGIHVAPDGRSFVTSIGTSQSTVWVHDSRGDRQITSEGYGFSPAISPDGKKLYSPRALRRRAELDLRSALGRRPGDRTAPAAAPRFPDAAILHVPTTGSVSSSRRGRIGPHPGLAGIAYRPDPAAADRRRWTAGMATSERQAKSCSGTRRSTISYRIKEDGSDLQKIDPTPGLFPPFSVSLDWSFGRR